MLCQHWWPIEENQLMITLEKWFTYYGGDKGKTNLRGYAQTTGIIFIFIFFLYNFLSKLIRIKRDEHRDINTQVHSLIICLSTLYIQLLFSLNNVAFPIWMSLWCWTQKLRFKTAIFKLHRTSVSTQNIYAKIKYNEDMQSRYNR